MCTPVTPSFAVLNHLEDEIITIRDGAVMQRTNGSPVSRVQSASVMTSVITPNAVAPPRRTMMISTAGSCPTTATPRVETPKLSGNKPQGVQ